MKNVSMKVTKKGNKRVLVIECDLDHEGGMSGSGKSKVVASTRGNVEVPDSDGAKLGLNLYRRV